MLFEMNNSLSECFLVREQLLGTSKKTVFGIWLDLFPRCCIVEILT